MKPRMFALLVMLHGFLPPAIVQGQSLYWGGMVDNSWHVGGNWSTGVAPDATSPVVIDGVAYTIQRICRVEGATGFCNTLTFTQKHNMNYLEVESALIVADLFKMTGTATVNIGLNGRLNIGGNANFGGVNSISSSRSTQLGHVSIGGNMDIGNGNRDMAVYNANGGSLSVTGSMTIAKGQSTRRGYGKLSIDGADVEIGTYLINGYGSGSVGAIGIIELLDGALHVKNYLSNADGGNTTGEAHGTLTVRGGDLEVDGDFHNGYFRSATINSQTYPELFVGGADASFRVHGSYSSLPNARLVMEITGPEHTAIRVDGDVALDGTLVVATNGVYRPRGGDSWEIIVADADGGGGNQIAGMFATVDLQGVEPFGDWKLALNDGATKLVLSLPRRGTVLFVK